MAKNLLQRIIRWNMRDASHGERGVAALHEAPVAAGFGDGVNLRQDSQNSLASESFPAKSEMILLVEDELFVREVAGNVLRSAGYQVSSARTAPEAMRIYDQCCGSVGLLLSDIVLPGQSGHELANALRRGCPSLKVLLMTGYSMRLGGIQADDSERAWLRKPFSAEGLLRKVREVLDAGGATGQQASRAKRVCGSG